MNRKLKVLVTSGGTWCPIDNVRGVTNIGSGLFGSQIAEELLKAGCSVYYLHSKGAKLPFYRLSQIDLSKPYESEINRVSAVYEEFSKLKDSSIFKEVENFTDYANQLVNVVNEFQPDICIMTMAASDYAPVVAEGKISSDKEELVLQMKKCPKVIKKLREENPDLFIVGFKLSSGLEQNVMITNAFKWMENGKLQMTVVNDMTKRNGEQREVVLINNKHGFNVFEGKDTAKPVVNGIIDFYNNL